MELSKDDWKKISELYHKFKEKDIVEKETLEDTPKVNVQQIEKYLEGIEHYNILIRRRVKMLYEQAQGEANKE